MLASCLSGHLRKRKKKKSEFKKWDKNEAIPGKQLESLIELFHFNSYTSPFYFFFFLPWTDWCGLGKWKDCQWPTACLNFQNKVKGVVLWLGLQVLCRFDSTPSVAFLIISTYSIYNNAHYTLIFTNRRFASDPRFY